MEQRDALAVHDLSRQGGDEGSTEQGLVLMVDSSVHGAAMLESVKKEDEDHVGEFSRKFFVPVGTAADLAGSGTPVLGASSSSAPAPVTASGSASKSKVAMAHASPPDSYRRVPSRSRKQYSPQRFITTRSALGDATAISCADDAPASSNFLPSRARKHPRPEHFIPEEEAEASAATKYRRTNSVLDRFLSSFVLHGSSTETSSEQAGPRVRGVGAAVSRLGRASPSSAAAEGSPRGELNGSARIYVVIAILGASLALSVVSCLLFYIVGRRSPGPP